MQKIIDILSRKNSRVRQQEREDRITNDKEILSEPFYFKGTLDSAVLLIHGWSSMPYEMRALGEYLHAKGHSVYAPLLAGHGTVPEDLEEIVWQEWNQDVRDAYHFLSQEHENIVVGGMSTGGSLVLHLAKACPDVNGLILMSTPYKMRYEGVGHYIAKTMQRIRPYKQKIYPKILGSERCMSQLISYQRYPYVNVFEALFAIKTATIQLDQITQPCLIIQSHDDHLVERRSAQKLGSLLGSYDVRTRYLSKAYHNFIADTQHHHIFEEMEEFIQVCNTHNQSQ